MVVIINIPVLGWPWGMVIQYIQYIHKQHIYIYIYIYIYGSIRTSNYKSSRLHGYVTELCAGQK